VRAGRTIALKKVKSRMDEGISCSALREVKLLRELQGEGGCPNVIQLLDVFCHKHKLLMVFECMDKDLGALIRCGHVMLLSQISTHMKALSLNMTFNAHTHTHMRTHTYTHRDHSTCLGPQEVKALFQQILRCVCCS